MSDTATPGADLGFVHRFVAGRMPRRAPLLLLHGTGGDEHDLIPFAERVAPGHPLLSPRGKVSEQGLARFFRRFPDGTWDIDDLEARTQELAAFVSRAIAAYRLRKPIALGYSNGANIAWSLLLRKPGLLAGAILMRATLPFDPRPLPDLSGVPVLLLAGSHDELVPTERTGLLAALLGEVGADVTYDVVPAAHALTERDAALAAAWLAARRAPAAPSP